MKKLIFYLLLLLLCGTFLFSGWMLWDAQSEYSSAVEFYDDMAQYVVVPETSEAAAQAPSSAEEEPQPTVSGEKLVYDDTDWPVVDFDGLLQLNPDVVGWIFIEGTAVNYPVVQGSDNSYYLKHLVDGSANGSGSIFLDCDSEPDFSGRNSVLYGHSMNNGTMFRGISRYKEQSFYDEHPVALLMTPQGNYKIRFFSGYVAELGDSAWDLYFTDDAYSLWLEEITGKSCFSGSVAPALTDRIVTLSTCSYEFEDARFVLHGIIEPAPAF